MALAGDADPLALLVVPGRGLSTRVVRRAATRLRVMGPSGVARRVDAGARAPPSRGECREVLGRRRRRRRRVGSRPPVVGTRGRRRPERRREVLGRRRRALPDRAVESGKISRRRPPRRAEDGKIGGRRPPRRAEDGKIGGDGPRIGRGRVRRLVERVLADALARRPVRGRPDQLPRAAAHASARAALGAHATPEGRLLILRRRRRLLGLADVLERLLQ
mmetsp:Transcript_5726/g.17006  ORF Transcript_5726/g.17006 Transcript_5726/m.17006 type:complete len:219 (-) Transcript_5726:725-1381(-)